MKTLTDGNAVGPLFLSVPEVLSSRSYERPAQRLAQTDDRRRNSNPDPTTKRTRPKQPAPIPAEQSGARLPPRD
ncbi:hypothetical protein CDAR_392771 [Caerostris darwini]|uniref:Uncharacterized protein n=1 Tax=Caerostris darwini TaxID=1538125 RepID=A0AAV4SSI4_9ARAC|nr:hypothetical protein CDAR_392771 [Caerostris darwini]